MSYRVLSDSRIKRIAAKAVRAGRDYANDNLKQLLSPDAEERSDVTGACYDLADSVLWQESDLHPRQRSHLRASIADDVYEGIQIVQRLHTKTPCRKCGLTVTGTASGKPRSHRIGGVKTADWCVKPQQTKRRIRVADQVQSRSDGGEDQLGSE